MLLNQLIEEEKGNLEKIKMIAQNSKDGNDLLLKVQQQLNIYKVRTEEENKKLYDH